MHKHFLANANSLWWHNIYTKAYIYNIGRNVRSVTFVETAKNSVLNASIKAEADTWCGHRLEYQTAVLFTDISQSLAMSFVDSQLV